MTLKMERMKAYYRANKAKFSADQRAYRKRIKVKRDRVEALRPTHGVIDNEVFWIEAERKVTEWARLHV